MTISECCGAETQVKYRSDHPPVYDDGYDFKIRELICTQCGKIVNLNPDGDLEKED